MVVAARPFKLHGKWIAVGQEVKDWPTLTPYRRVQMKEQRWVSDKEEPQKETDNG